MIWGKYNENGIWFASRWRVRLMTPFTGHDSIYIAIGPLRVRLMWGWGR